MPKSWSFLFSIRKKKNGIYIRQSNDVWPMYPFETLAFIHSLESDFDDVQSKNRTTLDLASGAGAISLFMAEKFKKVFSTDINNKAINYASFNAILNNFEDKIVNIESDIFDNLQKQKFDYIVWNGPTGAFPDIENPYEYYPQYIYGGEDGTKFTKKFLDDVFSYTTKNFQIKFLDCSLGNNKECLTETYIKNKFSNLPIKVKIEFLNKSGKQTLASYEKIYLKYCIDEIPMNLKLDKKYIKAVGRWQENLKKRKLNYVYFSYISISPSDKFTIEHVYPKESSFMPKHNFIFEWHYASKKFIKNYLLKNKLIVPPHSRLNYKFLRKK